MMTEVPIIRAVGHRISICLGIDIIGQNADYTIVDSESGYGLRIYDKIVADASAVEESQALY